MHVPTTAVDDIRNSSDGWGFRLGHGLFAKLSRREVDSNTFAPGVDE